MFVYFICIRLSLPFPTLTKYGHESSYGWSSQRVGLTLHRIFFYWFSLFLFSLSRAFAVTQHRSDSPQHTSSGSSPASHSSSSPAPPSSPSPQESPKNCSYIYRDWLENTSKSMSSIALPAQHHHQQQSHRSSPSSSAVDSIKSSHCFMPPNDNENHYANIESTSNGSNLLSSSWLPASKLPSFNWTRQFNDTLATIGSMLQRNFQIENYPSAGNVSEASASTATIGSNAALDENSAKKCKKTFSSNSKRCRNAADPNELDMLVLKTVDWNDDNDSDSYWFDFDSLLEIVSVFFLLRPLSTKKKTKKEHSHIL